MRFAYILYIFSSIFEHMEMIIKKYLAQKNEEENILSLHESSWLKSYLESPLSVNFLKFMDQNSLILMVQKKIDDLSETIVEINNFCVNHYNLL